MTHLDIAHAAVAAVLIFLTIWLIRRNDPPDAKRRWDWRIFVGVFIVMTIFNIVWPYSH
ncbi:hypothetical protein [Qipengyuania flava]|uniref:hypothetical protein n=1 Tax=Qipengyuania flava TaxID=192812 RepID=UPI001C6272E4|nr:hypothetical protein [Qipengyuania flava]QYJ07983.1 hypothetical protein KUV82_04555 [Qipengyuania flava]